MGSNELIKRLLDELDAALRQQLSSVKIDRAVLEKLAGSIGGASQTASGTMCVQLIGSMSAIESSESQGQILSNLVNEVSSDARGVAVILLGDPESNVLPGPGLGLQPGQPLGTKKLAIRNDPQSTFTKAAANKEVIAGPFSGSPADVSFYQALSAPPPAFMLAIPMAVRGKIQAVIIIDSDSPAGGSLDAEALLVLVRYAGMCLELLPLRSKVGHIPLPKIVKTGPSPAPTATTAHEPSLLDEFEIAPPAAPPAETAHYPGTGQPQQPAGAAKTEADFDTFKPPTPAPKIEEPQPAPAPKVMSPPVGPPKSEVSEMATDLDSAVAAAPPADMDGYGLEGMSKEEREKHEKAIRFARLLVSEIKLYNEETVRLGRENADIAKRLHEDIERSRGLYDERIGIEIRKVRDYFRDEVVAQLADGDESLMGE